VRCKRRCGLSIMPSSASSLVLGYPKSRKKFKDDSFTLPDPSYLGFRRYNKNHGVLRIPKVGWVKLRGWRPLGGELRSSVRPISRFTSY
jgi:hypothetical protein